MKRWRPIAWLVVSVVCFIGAIYFWRLGDKWQAEKSAKPATTAETSNTPATQSNSTDGHIRLQSSAVISASTAPVIALPPSTNTLVFKKTNAFPYRLSNTTRTVGQLSRDNHALLLENALIDSSSSDALNIPDSLKAQDDPGAYIVQAQSPMNDFLRAQIDAAGATRISYIPNNAYLVTATPAAASMLSQNFNVRPWEPYFKVKASLMPAALSGQVVAAAIIAVFPGMEEQTKAALEKMDATVTSESSYAFGKQFTVQNVKIAKVASLPGVQEVEPSFARIAANDLTRVIMNDSVDPFVPTNYLGLSGSNVIVAVADSFIPTNGATLFNPDLTNFIVDTNFFPVGMADTEGHGTHVGGIIGGSGKNSPTNAVGSQPGADFRGKAPLSTLYALPALTPVVSDATLQEAAARTNALISNNSWAYGTSDYNLAAANYDQAVRDSLPGTTGSQPVLYVWAAGNSGNGDDGGLQGTPDSILSPAVSKNGIAVAASELPRSITNDTWVCDSCDTNSTGCTTNQPWQGMTDTQTDVARFSSRGNVGIGVEGDFGRFKPDLVAPGTFVVSTRSMTWDQNAYYNPVTDDTFSFINETLRTNKFNYYSTVVPCDALSLTIQAVPVHPNPMNLPIYARGDNFPSPPADFVGFNLVSGTIAGGPDFTLSPVDTLWYYAIGNPTNETITYSVFSDVRRTNELGTYWDVLRTNLNDQLVGSNSPAPLYRYESGTSMAAPAVSGTLALMEDFFTNRLHYTPSPALLKALLINGARSLSDKYDFQVQNKINFQGWGLVNLTNSVPPGMTNVYNAAAPMIILDQDPTNALATGDTRTLNVQVNTNAQAGALRITLVWTDPPGNPAASIKLVNNLDLIVTNMDDPTNPVVFFGNNFPPVSLYTAPWSGDTNNIPQGDNVNNVENVYIPGFLGTNYSITVAARNVNVNAVTAHTNGVVQDYALVISAGNGDVTNALTLQNGAIAGNYQVTLTTMTNQFTQSSDTAGALLTGQRVGASSPLQGTNDIALTNQFNWGSNGVIRLGVTNQWHFYVITNTQPTNATTSFTNAAFATFLPSTLSIPPIGVRASDESFATRPEADIDLFVARGPNASNLTNLDLTTVSNSFKSLNRGGTEVLVFSNAQPDEVFYIGVHSEDQEAAEYDFFAVFSENPFSTVGPNGEQYLHGLNVPTLIPDGTPEHPGVATTVAIAVQPVTIRRVVVTNIMEHENFGDLVGTLSHNRIPVVLNNHTFGNGSTNQAFIYEDNDEGDVPGAIHPDGPGRLQDFIGQEGIGLWLLQETDNALFNTGRVDNVFIKLDPQADTNGVVATIPPNHFFYDFIDVPPAATNLTVCVNFIPPSTGPVELYISYGEQPTLGKFDYKKVINAPGDCLSVSLTDLPPLRPGRYYVGIYNPTAQNQTVRLTWSFLLDPNGVLPTPITSTNSIMPIPDDAVTNNSIFITNQQNIVTLNVGVVLKHPRVSDLDLTLVAPTGQRILLFENRGGLSATNMGHLNIFTNFFGAISQGDANENDNTIGPIPTSGTLIVDYRFYQFPDRLDVFDGNLNIFSSGLISDSGTFTIPYNLVNGNTLKLVMNQGNNSNPGTKWDYTPRIVSEDFTYLTFTDDTNLTDMPIKFAMPPYDGTDNGTNFTLSGFEVGTNSEFFAATNIPDAFGGWTLTTNDVFIRSNYFGGTNLLSMASNQVSVVMDPLNASSGSNYLALARGSISRTISLTPFKNYTISYFYRGPGIAGWWRGEGNATDSGDPELLGNNGNLIGRFNFPAGEVGQAFALEDSGLAFQFAGTNTYVQVPQSQSLDVGTGSGFTVEGWINPTNITFQQPMVEWLAHVPANSVVNGQSVSNLTILAGPFLNRETSHYYYLLNQTNWTTSELWAKALGGHLVEVNDANEQNWIYDTFAQFAGSNYTMWIGLTNRTTGPITNFVWSTGDANVGYTNWAFGEPTNCPTAHCTAILSATNGLPGLWTLLDDNGLKCTGGPINKPFGVVEVNDIQTNGVQFWVSVTNAATPGLGRLYANIFDTNGVPHEIFSPAGLIQSNIYQHVALTYNTNTGVANLYYAGTNVASTNLGVFVPKTGGDVLIGKDMSRATNNFFWGRMDEMSIYSRFLSPSEILAIYRISAGTTNRNIGKFDPAITPAESLGEAQVSFGGITNLIFGNNNGWQVQGFSLKTVSNTLPVQFTGIEPGVLLDSFSIYQKPPGNLYYFPEQPLQALVGSNAFGNWTLEIRDARTGAIATNAELQSWQLQFILQTNTPTPIQLDPQTPATNNVPPGQIAYFKVFVPAWANTANNVLVSSTSPVDLLFNQNTPPGTGAPGDFSLLNNSTGGAQLISAVPPSNPPLIPGQTYYLGVRNNGAVSAQVVVRVDFDITTLLDGIPVTSTLGTNDVERPYVFNVSSNATEATFQLLKMNGNADLVLRKGLPLPTLLSADYGSFSGSNADETIYVLTNSLPVPLSQGPWYLDVIKRSSATDSGAGNTVTYSVLAKELTNAPTIITLNNRVPMNFTAGPGAALTNFFKFSVANFPLAGATNLGIHFELFNQTGNGDLTVQTNALPLAPPFLQSSRLPFDTSEIIFIHTNASSSTNLNADWYLGVPNNEIVPINYTIVAEIDTNGFAAFPTAEGSGADTRGGALSTNVYHVTTLADSGFGSFRDGVNTLTNGGTIVFDRFGTITLNAPLLITNSFLTIAGQTAPGSGITVAAGPAIVQNAHDLIIRYLRFRSDTNISVGDSLQVTNSLNIIIDHISAEFGATNDISVLNSSNVTVQWSVMAESQNRSDASSGGSVVRHGAGGVTFHHNLYADNYSGNPVIGENVSLDFVNNVVFNWGLFAGFSTNDLANNPGGLTNFLNYSGNYLIAGSNSVFTNMAFWSGSASTWIFQTNNFIDTNKNTILDGANISWGMFANQYTPFSHAFDISPPTAPDEAFIAYERVLDFAGASLEKRDTFDRGVVQRTRLQPAITNASGLLSGMVSWWKAEGNAADSVGSNNGTLVGGLGFVPGEVGQAFNSTGAGTYVTVPASPSLNVGASNGFSIEGWINPSDVSVQQPLVQWEPTTPGDAVNLWISVAAVGGGAGSLYANIIDTGLVSHQISSVPGVITNGGFQHVAVTYDKTTGVATLYCNGTTVASQNLGVFTPDTVDGLLLGYRRTTGENFKGSLDEFSVYNRALTPCEIAAVYNAGTAGKQSVLASSTNSVGINQLPYLDIDRDGIPDFWEITLGENATNFSSYLDRDGDGYTDLEEYMNWLGVPHALTLKNTQTNVDLYTLSGNTGNLLFGVQNGTNGTVYLTNFNACAVGGAHIAVFTPSTNNFGNGTNGGFASFSYMVTNTDTMAHFGPVTVSVFVSTVPITNSGASTNIVTFTNPPPNQTIFETVPYSYTNGAVDSDTNALLSYTITTIINTNATLAHGWPLTNLTLIPSPTIDANGIITWTPTETQGPGVYTITTVVADNGIPPAHATNTFDLTVNESNRPPVFVGTPSNITNIELSTITVSNSATDPDIPYNPLGYTLLNPPAGMTIDTNGTIIWTPTLGQAGTYTITTVVTDTNIYAPANQNLSATNIFTIVITPAIAPFVFTQPAQAVTTTSAKLNGMATPNGLPTVAWFEWGTNTLYGNQTPAVNIGNSFNVVYTNANISGLIPNVPYHFRMVVSNVFGGPFYGFDQILDQARVVAWGADYVKQIEVPPGMSNMVAVAGAYDHSLALKDDGTVVAWGDNTFGQTNVPPGLNSILAIAGGQYNSMALKNNGTVVAWGPNLLNVTNVPPGLNNVVMIASGTTASLALRNNGSIVSWGANLFNVTNPPPGLNNVVEVAGGSYHSLAIRNNGTVVAWGDNSAGQTNVPPSATNVVAIAGGNYHSLALRYDGTVVSWGDNSAGQTNVPAGLTNVVAIAAGGFHSLALKSDGTVVGWGDNTAGQAGIPTGLTNVVAISAGYFHNLALTPSLLLTNPIVLPTTNGLPQTNSILGDSTVFYRVNVPANADAASNELIFTVNGPLNIWYSTNTPPTVGTPVDFHLLTNAVNGTSLVTSATSPQLVPGGTYYLGVQNTNTFAISYAIQVDFHLTASGPLTNTVPISGIVQTNMNGTNGFLLIWYAPTNDLFQVQWANGLPPVWNTFTNIIGFHTFIDPTNSEFEFFDDGSQTGGLSPGRYYQLILLNGTLPPPPLPTLTDGVPVTTNIAPGTVTFYQVNVPTNVDFVTNSLLPSSSPLNLWFTTNVPPTVGGATDYLLFSNAASGLFTSTVGSGAPPTFVPGATYYLGVQNTNATTANYGVQVDFHFLANTNNQPLTNTVPISGVIQTNRNGTNGFLLVWFAPTNDLFQVQWAAGLPPVWHTFTNIIGYHTFISPTNSEFEFFDDGSQTGGFTSGRYYQLILLNGAVVTPPTTPALLTNGVPVTTNIAPGTVTFYQVNVPTNVDFVTNSLLPASASLNLWFTTNVPPTVGGATDYLLVSNAASGSFTSATGSGAPPTFVLGTTYYLGVQNTNATVATYGVQVDFHFLANQPMTNTVPISGVIQTNRNGTNGFLLVWFAPTNDMFQVQWAAGLPPVWHTFTNIIGYHTFISPTNSEFEFFDDGSQTGGFTSGRYYQLILLNSAVVTPPATPTLLTNGVTVTTNIPAGTTSFYQVNVPANVDSVTNSLLAGTAPLNLWFTTNVPPTVGGAADYLLVSNSASGSFTSASGSGAPPTFVPGATYYLGVQNTNATAATYGVRVDFHFLANQPQTNTVPIAGVVQTNRNGTNGFLLVWFAPTNELFQVQWAAGLPPNWHTFTNIVSYHTFINATNSEFEFFDDGSQTGGFLSGRFYQLILLNSAPVTPPSNPASTNVPPISNITSTNVGGTNSFLLTWFAPTNDLFQVQWSPNPATGWTTFTNIISYSTYISPTNSQFTFRDDGSQSGGLGSFRFYRLVLYNGAAPNLVTIVPLANGVPLNFTTGAGLTNYFSFDITQTNAAVLFELYNLTGDGNLTAQQNSLPVSSPAYASANTGTNFEQIVIRTNGAVPNLNAVSWFLGVPNQSGSPISYTIRATVPTNGMLVSGQPLSSTYGRPGGTNVQIVWGPTVPGEKYEIRTNGSLGSPNWIARTDVVATATSASFTDPTLPPIGSSLFYEVIQVP